MHPVWLTAFPMSDKYTFQRIVRKQRRGASDDEISDLLDEVSGGKAHRIRAFAEDESAENLVKEFQRHGGSAEVREAE
jgi:hypothetical protein